MSRQVDIKALISHIVRGDGIDRCRICMGDTSEGQVNLGDTVMMDGERPVTLAELLETVTGVQVLPQEDLPTALCHTCSMAILAAAEFRIFCHEADRQWTTTISLLEGLTYAEPKNPSLYALVQDNKLFVVDKKSVAENEFKHVPKTDIPKRRKSKRKGRCQCPDCGKRFMLPKALHEHLMDSTDLKRACFICAEVMQHDDFKTHLQDRHQKEVFDCKKCHVVFLSQKRYARHARKAHASGAFSCGDCGRSFKSRHAFCGHTSMHIARNCPSCDKLFRNHRCYLYHVRNCCNLNSCRDNSNGFRKVQFEIQNKTGDRTVKVGPRGSVDEECFCDYCGKKFSAKKFVCAHIQIVHMKNTHRPCPYCGKSLAAAHMTEHIKKHEEIQLFTCEHCGIVLKSRLGHSQHIRLHTGEKPYVCKYCSEAFSASSRRSEHIRKVHKKPEDVPLRHGCEFCKAKFRLPCTLKRHIAKVHDESATSAFECTVCLVKFATHRGLLYHSRRHETFRLNKAKDHKVYNATFRTAKVSLLK